MTISLLLKLLAGVISVYTMLCFIRIILTWIPGASYSGFGRFLCAICDPYLNLFRGISWLRFSNFDFTPAFAMCILIILSTILSNFAVSRMFTVGALLAMLLTLLWSVFSSFLIFILIFFGVRLAILLMHRDGYNTIWEQVDRSISPFVFKITSIFSGGRPVSYKNALIAGIVIILVMLIGGRFLINIFSTMLIKLPF